MSEPITISIIGTIVFYFIGTILGKKFENKIFSYFFLILALICMITFCVLLFFP